MSDVATAPLPNVVPILLTFDTASGFEAPSFQVVSGRLEMGISEHFELRLVVQHTDPCIDLGNLLRRNVNVHFAEEAFLSDMRGIIRRAAALSTEPAGLTRYELRIVPPIFLLHRRRNHRIFAKRSVPEILETLLGEHNANSAPTSALLTDSHPARIYTVQYAETDLRLVRRLIADEGMVFLFDFARNGGQLTLVDDTAKQGFQLAQRLPFVAPSQLVATAPAIYSIVPKVQTSWGAAAIREYDYQRPLLEIDGRADAPARPREADLEDYIFEVGEVSHQAAADKRARDTLASQSNRDQWVVCSSTAVIAPGTKFSIDGSVRPEGSTELLVCWTTSTWTADLESGRFERQHTLACIDASRSFKTPRLDKPRIAGVQTGVVVGRANAEIDVDEKGEVEVEFRWDRDAPHVAGLYRRVRISHGWAGPGYGLVTFPRVGDEVVVAYLDGDPDQPLIVGRVHNPTRPNPLKPHEQPTVSVWRSRSSPGGNGYNEILMDDLAGQERLDMHAQRDFSTVVERDAKENVGRNLDVAVAGNTTSRIAGTAAHAAGVGSTFIAPKVLISADDLLTLVGGHTDFSSDTRADLISSTFNVVAGSEYTEVKDVFQVVGPNFHVFASESIHLQVNGSTVHLDSGKIELKIGGSSIVMTAGQIELISPLINLNP